MPGPEQKGQAHDARHAPQPPPPPGRRPRGWQDREPLAGVGAHGAEERPHQQGLGPGVGPVVEPVDRGPGLVQGEHQRGRGDRPDAGDQGQPGDPPSAHHEQRDQRPDQVVLLLDGQRPGVQEGRRGRRLGEVPLLGEDEVPVGHVEERGQRVGPHGAQVERVTEHVGVRRHAEHQDEQRGNEAAGPLRPEPPQPDGAGAGQLPAEEGGDEEPREDEEHVHTEQAAPGPRDAGVVAEHRQHGQGADAVQSGEPPEAPPVRLGPCHPWPGDVGPGGGFGAGRQRPVALSGRDAGHRGQPLSHGRRTARWSAVRPTGRSGCPSGIVPGARRAHLLGARRAGAPVAARPAMVLTVTPCRPRHRRWPARWRPWCRLGVRHRTGRAWPGRRRAEVRRGRPRSTPRRRPDAPGACRWRP